MDSHDIFELQQACAEQDYLLNRALDRLAAGEPLIHLDTLELDALTDRCIALRQDRQPMRELLCTAAYEAEPF